MNRRSDLKYRASCPRTMLPSDAGRARWTEYAIRRFRMGTAPRRCRSLKCAQLPSGIPVTHKDGPSMNPRPSMSPPETRMMDVNTNLMTFRSMSGKARIGGFEAVARITPYDLGAAANAADYGLMATADTIPGAGQAHGAPLRPQASFSNRRESKRWARGACGVMSRRRH